MTAAFRGTVFDLVEPTARIAGQTVKQDGTVRDSVTDMIINAAVPELLHSNLMATVCFRLSSITSTAKAVSDANFVAAGHILTLAADATVSGTNTGDATTIVGITGTIAQFNTACTDADFAIGGGIATGTNTGDQTNITGNAATVTTNANLTGEVTSVGNAATVTRSTVFNWTAAHTFSVAGAASTPAIKLSGTPFSGTGATSFPQFYLNDATATASTTLSTAGTWFGINSHGTQRFIDLMVDGATKFKVDSTGLITTAAVTHVVGSALGIETAGWEVGGSANSEFGVAVSNISNGASAVSGLRLISDGQYIAIWSNSSGVSSGSYFNSNSASIFNTGVNGIIYNNYNASGTGHHFRMYTNATDIVTIGNITQNFKVTADAAGTIAALIQRAASASAPGIKLQTSAAGSLGNVSGGCIGDVFADTSTTHTDGTFDQLATITTVANALIVNGDKIEFDYTLVVTAHALSTDQIQIIFAGITIFDSGANNFASAGTIRIYGQIERATATTCRATVEFLPAGSVTILGFEQIAYTPEATLTAMTLTGTNILKIQAAATGTNSASGDVKIVQGSYDIVSFGS